MKNEYEIRGEITILFIRRRDGSAIESIIDTSDLQKLLDYGYSWCASRHPTKPFYVHSSSGIKLHRFLIDAPVGLYVDHKNHDTLDNRKSNLRLVTIAENNQNKSKAQCNSKSGIRGVFWSERSKKWKAQIKVNGRHKHLGLFKEINDAIQAVKEAKIIYHPFNIEY